jgi:hypothetical protein
VAVAAGSVPDLPTAAFEFTQQDIALVDLVREAQTVAAVAEHQLPEGTSP